MEGASKDQQVLNRSLTNEVKKHVQIQKEVESIVHKEFRIEDFLKL